MADPALADVPYPPRFWWLKRLAVVVALILAIGAASDQLIRRKANQRLAEHVAQWEAEGGPVPADIASSTRNPSGQDNAAVHWIAAYAAIPPLTTVQATEWDNAQWTLPVRGRQLEVVRTITRQDAPAFAMVERARQADRLDWDNRAVSIVTLLGRLNQWRELANHLGWSVMVRHAEGDVAGALQRVEDLLALRDDALTDGPTLVTGLVMTGIDGIASHRAREVVTYPPVDESTEAAAWLAAEEDAQRLIERLLDDEFDRRLWEVSLRGERVMTSSMATLPNPAAAGFGLGSGFSHPHARWQIADLLDQQKHVLETRPDDPDDGQEWMARMKALELEQEPASSLPALAATIMRDLLGSIPTRAATVFIKARTDRRAAAVMIALRLYEAEHGKLPATLDALVPAYLPFLPRDPFDADGGTFRYRPEGPVPILWSVGENGIDEGGSVADLNRRQWTSSWSARDAVYPLRPAPTGEQVEAYLWRMETGEASMGEGDEVEHPENGDRSEGGNEQ